MWNGGSLTYVDFQGVRCAGLVKRSTGRYIQQVVQGQQFTEVSRQGEYLARVGHLNWPWKYPD